MSQLTIRGKTMPLLGHAMIEADITGDPDDVEGLLQQLKTALEEIGNSSTAKDISVITEVQQKKARELITTRET